jgi:hypothetical protein
MDKPPKITTQESHETPKTWEEVLALAEQNNFEAIFELIDSGKFSPTTEQKLILNQKQDAFKLPAMHEAMETEEVLTFWRGATMNDLFTRLEMTNESMNEMFFVDLAKRFTQPEFVEAFWSGAREVEIGNITILDFFKRFGCGEEQLMELLPLKFSER